MLDFQKNDDENERPIHATPFSREESRSLFQKFKAVAVLLFTGWQDTKAEHQLTGRIHALQNTANQVLADLNQLKTDLEQQADSDLLGSLDAVVKPIVRDVERIQRKVVSSQSLDERKDAAERYTQWIERARPWVHFLSANLKDRDAIIQAVVKHTIQTSEELVKRDLQVISDYQKHKLAELAADNGENRLLKNRLEQALSKHLEDLSRLQRSEPPKPGVTGLKELEVWKERIENLREKLYNKSLQIIDEIFAGIHSKETKEQHDHVIANLSRIANIEEKINQLHRSLRKHVLDEDEIHACLDQLQKETRHILQELALTPELADRVYKVRNEIETIRENMLKFG